jgi:O-antigen/teichoic acid export membrane protein
MALLAESLNSLGTFVVTIYVARVLSPATLGQFSFLFAVLLVIVGIQTSWVGDTLTVLDRSHPEIKRGLHLTQHLLTASGFVAGGLIAATALDISVVVAISFGALVATWQLQEYGRRIFMARLEFHNQARNDGLYLVVVTALLAMPLVAAWQVSLAYVLCAMALASGLAFLTSYFTMPPIERLQINDLRGPGLRRVASYGGWRAGQVSVGNLSQAITRYLVIALASSAMMGVIQAAYLTLAPLFTLFAAATNVMLPVLTRAVRRSPAELRRWTLLFAALITSASLIYGLAVLAAPSAIVHLIAGDQYSPSMLVIGGWIATALAVGLGLAFTSAALVVENVATVFWQRTMGSLLGLVIVVGVLVLSQPAFVPVALACGAALSTGLLFFTFYNATVAGSPSDPGLHG